MKTLAFASRNSKEMLRDKINLMFGIGFPVVLLLLLTLIQSNIPVQMFEIAHLTPGIAVFGLAFISLFSATLIFMLCCTAFPDLDNIVPRKCPLEKMQYGKLVKIIFSR